MKRFIIYIVLAWEILSLQAQDTILVHPTTPIASVFAGNGLMWDCSSASSNQEQYIYFRPGQNNTFSVYDGFTRYHLVREGDTTFLTGYENSSFQITLSQPAVRFCNLYYGDTIKTDYSGIGEYCHSASYNIVGSAYLTTDAEGTVCLPTGRFSVYRSRYHRDILMQGLDTVNVLEDTYQWFTPAISFPLFEQHEVREISEGRDSLVLCQALFYELSEDDLLQIAHLDSLSLSSSPIISSLSHFPNPVKTDMLVSYTLGIDAQVTILVTTDSGLPMWRADLGWQEAGEHTLTVDMSGFPLGAYELHACAGGLIISETVLKL